MKLSNIGHEVFIRAFGKLFRVVAVCDSAEEANKVCANNPAASVIDEDEAGRVWVAESEPAE